jgi:hypothetical protein
MRGYCKYEDGLWRFGRWTFGLFDDGWMIARDMIIKREGRWPTYRTFWWR